MKKLLAITALTLALSSPASAYVHHYYMHKIIIPPHAGTSTAGASAVGGFLAFVAVLAGYDLLRRTTCIGDPWRLGGPGFGEPMPNGNVMTPLYMRGGCGARPKAIRVRG
jgi:hypothetical protein